MTSLPPSTRRMARALHYFAWFGIAFIIAGCIRSSINVLPDMQMLAGRTLTAPITWQVSAKAQALFVALHWLHYLPMLFGVFQIARLFRTYADDQALSPRAAIAIRRIGLGAIAQALTNMPFNPLKAMILTMDAPAGQQSGLFIWFSSDELWLFLGGGLMLVIGFVTRQAAAVSQENAEFV